MPSRYQSFTADRIFDGLGGVHTDTAVVFSLPDGRVEALLPVADTPDAERFPGSLAPGLINAHGHLELSYLKGRIPRDLGMIPFLEAVMQSRQADDTVVQTALREAEAELRREGIVGMGDIANTTDSLNVKVNSSLRFQTFVEVFGLGADALQSGVQRGLPVLRAFEKNGQRASLSPHAPYSVRPELMRRLGEMATGQPLSIHMQESPAEEALFREGTGDFPHFYRRLGLPSENRFPEGTSLQYTLNALPGSQRILLVHNLCSSPQDIAEAATSQHDVWWCLCPGANRYIQNRLPDPSLFQKHPDRVLIGTDSLASNDRLSVLREMQLLLQVERPPDPALLFRWACSNAARFFGWDSELGSLEKGKKPGLIAVSPGTDGEPIGPGSSVTSIRLNE